MAYKDKGNAIKYNNEFIKQAYDRINLTIPKGLKEEWQAAAASVGLSLNAYILEAVEARRAGGGFGVAPGEPCPEGVRQSPSRPAESGEGTPE